MKPIEFRTEARPRFAELDPYGHLSTESYLAHFIQHRFDGMRDQLGLDLATLGKHSVAFFVRKVSLEFLQPVTGDLPFTMTSVVTRWGTTSCTVEGKMTSGSGERAADCIFEFICIDRKTNKPAPWPEAFKSACFVTED